MNSKKEKKKNQNQNDDPSIRGTIDDPNLLDPLIPIIYRIVKEQLKK